MGDGERRRGRHRRDLQFDRERSSGRKLSTAGRGVGSCCCFVFSGEAVSPTAVFFRMESIWAAYGDDFPQPTSGNNTEVVHDDYRSGEDNAPSNGNKTHIVQDDYQSGGDNPSEEDRSIRDARFDESLLNFYMKNKVKRLKRKLTSTRVDKTPISHTSHNNATSASEIYFCRGLRKAR